MLTKLRKFSVVGLLRMQVMMVQVLLEEALMRPIMIFGLKELRGEAFAQAAVLAAWWIARHC